MESQVQALAQVVGHCSSVLLTGPHDNDGDSIGACLALARAIGVKWPGCRVDVAGVPSFRYDWMTGADRMVPDADVQPDYDAVVVMDGDRSRVHAAVGAAFEAAQHRVIVDHHRTTRAAGYSLSLLDPDAESTCGMVLRILDGWGVPLDRPMAELLYVGVIFDTGGFRYSNTESRTHRMAARLLDQGIDHSLISERVLLLKRVGGFRLNARVLSELRLLSQGRLVVGEVSQALVAQVGSEPSDIEGIVDQMVFVEGVQLAILLVERAPGQIKLSLRSRGQVDVAKLARALSPGGGGHARAAGAMLFAPLDQVRAELPGLVEAHLVP